MASEMKQIVQGLLESQLEMQDPRCTSVAYDRLTGAGLSDTKAKDKIASVLMSEIYTSTLEQSDFDEKRYAKKLRKMVNETLERNKDASPDPWDLLEDHILEGSVAKEKKDYAAASDSWLKAWNLLKDILVQTGEKPTLTELEAEKDYRYDIGGWLREVPEVLRKSRRCDEYTAFCRQVLESFCWNPETSTDPEKDSDTDFQKELGISLYLSGKTQEGKAFFDAWLAKDPGSAEVLDGYAEALTAAGQYDEAYRLLSDALKGQACSMSNNGLFSRLASLAVTTGHKEEAMKYRKMVRDYINTLSGNNDGTSSVFGADASSDNPIDAFLNGLGNLHM